MIPMRGIARREFLAWSGLGLAQTLSGCASIPFGCQRDLVLCLVAQNDARVAEWFGRQQTNASHPAHGGVVDSFGMYHAGAVSGFLRDLAVAYVSPGGRYRHAPALVERMTSGARFLRRIQNDDGTIDLVTTNFHSPPDTGFVLEWICAATGILRSAQRPELEPVLRKLDEFIVKAAAALSIGGIHTPNHRWVVCMALARANVLHPNPRYVARIDQWLAEGIDIDPDGQFTERSTSIYSPLTDRCLITVARLLDRPQLLEPVRRNLEMTMYYAHANGEIVTEGSRRQDQYRKATLARYYYPYRYMALRDRNGGFAAIARDIEASPTSRLSGSLVYFLEDPGLRVPLPAATRLPDDYEKWFRHSDLVRIRRGNKSATILADNSTFFSLHLGGAAVAVRFASAFFGKGQFVGHDLHKQRDGGWTMHQDLTGPYYQPLDPAKRRPDGEWSKEQRDSRAHSGVQRLRSTVTVREEHGGFVVAIDVRGTDRVPVAVELGFRRGGSLAGVRPVDGVDGAYLLAGSEGRYGFGGDRIGFGPGRVEHTWTQLRGALQKFDGDSVYLTGFTPFASTLRFS